jgi:hypothetical protein
LGEKYKGQVGLKKKVCIFGIYMIHEYRLDIVHLITVTSYMHVHVRYSLRRAASFDDASNEKENSTFCSQQAFAITS